MGSTTQCSGTPIYFLLQFYCFQTLASLIALLGIVTIKTYVLCSPIPLAPPIQALTFAFSLSLSLSPPSLISHFGFPPTTERLTEEGEKKKEFRR
jgi:hypothetical protein